MVFPEVLLHARHEVVIDIPGHALPHRTGREFPAEELAKAWINSQECVTLIAKLSAKYAK